jgi:beta-phosphoglucomutase-like phosphatase (HAD superfamily)
VVGVTSGVAAGMKVIAIKREAGELPGVWMNCTRLAEIDVAEVFK